MSGSSRKSSHFSHTKLVRRSGDDAASGDVEGIELEDFRARAQVLYSPIDASSGYDMQKAGHKQQMAADIWTADFAGSMEGVRAANPEIVRVLEAQTANSTPQTEISILHKRHQIDGILLNMVRARSIHIVPLLTVANSVMCEANLVKRAFHDTISFTMKGALMSEAWIESFMKQASLVRPPPTGPMIPGVMVVTFDNLTMNVAYKSMCIGGQTGEKLDMTNWFSVLLPLLLAPTLDGMRACAWRRLEPGPTLPTNAHAHALTTHASCTCSSQRNLPRRPLARWLLPPLLPRQPADRRQ